MILSLLSMLGGGLMRLLPEIMSFLNRKQDNAHELAMLDRQAQLETTRAAARMDEIQVQGNFTEMLALLDAQKAALKSQMQKTGIRFVDALNFLVRPLVTYFMVLLYAAAKVAMYMIAVKSGVGGWEAVLRVYDDEDRAILAGILAFWFVGRSVDKAKGL
ncbi:MAG: hypothetical protein ACXWVD_00310 [Telluria sp.]